MVEERGRQCGRARTAREVRGGLLGVLVLVALVLLVLLVLLGLPQPHQSSSVCRVAERCMEERGDRMGVLQRRDAGGSPEASIGRELR